jgi:RNA polymerase sigma-70 factor (ECF subfamily)
MKDERLKVFEGHRAHLLGLAYRMLGEMAGAEDVVQEAWLRWQRAHETEIREPRAWLSTVTIRLALDGLRAARSRRETYVGPWLPEPLLPDDMRALAADAPAARAELASDLSIALLHVLERLSPEERAALILHDAFDCDYDEIAAMLERSEAACRKLVSRARKRVRADRPRYSVSGEKHKALVARFTEAAALQDPAKLVPLFADDIVFYSDGGGRVTTALNPVHGSDHVARLIAGLVRKQMADIMPELVPCEINGRPAMLMLIGGEVLSAMTTESDRDKITAIYVMRNPEKLARLASAITRPSAR